MSLKRGALRLELLIYTVLEISLACVQPHKQQEGILTGCSPGGAVLGGCLGLTLAAKAAKAQSLGIGDGHRCPLAETSYIISDRSSSLASEESR